MELLRTREEQLAGLARFYRRDGQTACAEAIEWALAEIDGLRKRRNHASDCALHNAPALPCGECSCIPSELCGCEACSGSPDAWRG